MKRREVSKLLSVGALTLASSKAIAADYCDDDAISFDEFQKICWEQVVAAAASEGGKFKNPQACKDAYIGHEGGKWFDKFKCRFALDLADGRNPCDFNDHAYFAEKYYFCTAKVGKKAASIAVDPQAITKKEFEVAMGRVKVVMDKWKRRNCVPAEIRDYLCS